MTYTLPIFPLKIVVFPNEKLNLHIFEPRYRQLIEDCEKTEISFSIPFFLENEIMPIMTVIKLEKIQKRYLDGSADVSVKATDKVVRIKNIFKTLPEKLYAGAEVEELQYFYNNTDPVLSYHIHNKIAKLYTILKIEKNLPNDPQKIQMFDIAHHIGLTPSQEFQLLALTNEYSRQEFVNSHLLTILPIVEEMEELKKKAQLNGHFRKIPPLDF